MPRARKTPNLNEVAPGGAYGDRAPLEESLSQQPIPDRRAMDEGALHNAAIEAASAMPAQMPPGGMLGQPSMRPNEPITAGLPRGAGPGPEALGMPTQQQDRIRQQLQMAAEITRNPTLIKMAQQAQRPIGQPIIRRP